MSEDKELPTAEDIRDLSWAICLLTEAMAERTIVEGYRVAKQTESSGRYALSATSVEETAFSLKERVANLKQAIKKRSRKQ